MGTSMDMALRTSTSNIPKRTPDSTLVESPDLFPDGFKKTYQLGTKNYLSTI